jgi:three-Cys-motif partner protein
MESISDETTEGRTDGIAGRIVSELVFSEIGYWSELKLEIIEKYGAAYTSILSKQRLKKYYIDAFSGPGVHVSKESKAQVAGSPARALKVSPPFDGYYFIDLEKQKTDYLQKLCGNRPDVHIYTADATTCLTNDVLPTISYEKYTRALCLLDPYGLHLDWSVILQAGQSRAIDMFLNFPVMDMNRNAIWKNPDNVPQDGLDRMTKFWGDESWKKAAYAENPQTDLFGQTEMIKQENAAIVVAFRQRLKTVAGFQSVPEPLPMKNSNNAVVYYLFFASQKPVAEKIITEIFAKYR